MSLGFLSRTSEFRAVLDALRRGRRPVEVSGLVEAAKPYFLATLLAELEAGSETASPGGRRRPVLFIRPSTASLSDLRAETLRFARWLCRNDLAAGRQVLAFPQLSDSPYQEIPPSLEAVSSRMRLFHALLHQPPVLVVSNLLAILKPIPRPSGLKKSFLTLEKGGRAGRDRLLEILKEYGYSRQDLVTSHGEYAWRGGIVDLFSPWKESPFRVEFSADTVASLREFDPSTQRTTRHVDRIIVPGLREYSGSAGFLDAWEKTALSRASESELGDLGSKTAQLRSGESLPSFAYLSLLRRDEFAPLTGVLKDPLFIIDDDDEVAKDWEAIKDSLADDYQELVSRHMFALPPDEIFPSGLWEEIRRRAVCLKGLSTSGRCIHFAFQSVPRFENRIPFFLNYLKRRQEERDVCLIFISGQGVRMKMAALLSQSDIPHAEASDPLEPRRDISVGLFLGDFEHGFSYTPEKIHCFAEADILTEEKVLVSRPRVRPFVSHFQDLQADDHVVHSEYGIGIFKGLIRMEVDGRTQEFIEIRYRDDDILYVPVEDLNLVQKYAKIGMAAPVLNKLGTPVWEKTKARTKKAIEKIARELLQLYAQRKAMKGHAFSPAGSWHTDFEKMFEYEETEDQLLAIREIMQDMDSESSMDRLLCGDVGYGKTEVALRAAFRAVMDGKQVGILCPTTVLSSQHLKTFRNRMVLFPVRVESLTRLQNSSQQKKLVAELGQGLIDIVIGTHRLLSSDVVFKDLGLLIIDEEQRFGVSHKEKIKAIKTEIDVLTLTATPIPRTLNMSLAGLRDISLIETPPRDRLAIHTVVTPFSRNLVVSAIRTELARGGQVYFVHNKVEDIDSFAAKIEDWIPQARVAIVHGQMPGLSLEKRMIDFIQHRYDILVSTTIIENGIDIPLVNTLVVNRADQFGLAQLYQLRGRVGRSSRQAFAYFLVPGLAGLTPTAKARLKALQEFSELGSGFRLAAKDMEIRGAGNFLGSQQHGYMAAVGFDTYMQLLEQTVRELKGEKTEELKTEINLKVDIRIPEDYLPQINLRLNLYKRISSAESVEEVKRIQNDIGDRYGPIPSSVDNLLGYGVVKLLAQRMRIRRIDRIGRKLVFDLDPGSRIETDVLPAVLNRFSGTLTPEGVMTLRLTSEDEAAVMDETILVLKRLSNM